MPDFKTKLLPSLGCFEIGQRLSLSFGSVLILFIIFFIVASFNLAQAAVDIKPGIAGSSSTPTTDQVPDQGKDRPTQPESITLTAQLQYTPTYQQQKQGLLDTFRNQIIAYQQAYKDFVLAKKQFEQLKTIESLNEAIEATRLAALRRDQVVFTYLELLRLELIQPHPSLDPALRNQVVRSVDALLVKLNQHRRQLETVETRDDLYQALVDYGALYQQITNFSYFARYMLKVDKLFWLDQRLVSLRQQLVAQGKFIAGQNKLAELKFRRGLDEIDKQISQAKQGFDQIKTKIYQTKSSDDNWYQEAVKVLSKVYAADLRATNYAVELLTTGK